MLSNFIRCKLLFVVVKYIHNNFCCKIKFLLIVFVVTWKVIASKSLIKIYSYSQWEIYIGSLLRMQIRQINLPVSLHLPEAYGSYVISRLLYFSWFFFIFAFLSLSLSRISFFEIFRSVPHWVVIKIVFLHYLIFTRGFKFTIAHLIIYLVFWRFIL